MAVYPQAYTPPHLGPVLSCERMAYGMSGADVFRVETTQGRFVLRIQTKVPELFRTSLPYLRRAAAAGIAPRLVHVDEARHCILSDEVRGVLFGRALAAPESRDAAVGSLIAQLRKLASLDPTGLPPDRPSASSARQIWVGQHQRPGFPAWAAGAAPLLDAVDAVLAADPRRVLSHGDLNPTNMLWDGARVWFVDWDMVGVAHPYSDLGVVTTFLDMVDEPALMLLGALQGSPVTSEQARTFATLRAGIQLIYGCGFLQLIPDLTKEALPSVTDALTLSQCYARMQNGELDSKSPAGHALMGCALLRSAVRALD